jgi:hypothetical protein
MVLLAGASARSRRCAAELHHAEGNVEALEEQLVRLVAAVR